VISAEITVISTENSRLHLGEQRSAVRLARLLEQPHVMRVAIYARVSTLDQQPENQLLELRRYAEARGWRVVAEHIDHGVSGAKERRPALDALRVAAKRRHIDAVLCWRLERLGRNLRHLILLLDELQALGVAFVSLAEGIDATTPAGKLQLHILGAIAEFERERIRERVRRASRGPGLRDAPWGDVALWRRLWPSHGA
jgi:DNA invertase Pin-like site-specific DNA recombinase